MSNILSFLLRCIRCISIYFLLFFSSLAIGTQAELIKNSQNSSSNNKSWLTKEEIAWIKKNSIITVSNEDDWAPFDFNVNGEAKGYSVDLLDALAKLSGLQLKFVNGYSWQSLVSKFDNKEIMLMHVFPKLESRKHKYIYSKPYMDWKLSYWIRQGDTSIDSTIDFKQKKIGVVQGWDSSNLIKAQYSKAIIVEYKNSLEMFKALAFGSVDVAIDNISTANYLLTKELIANVKVGGEIALREQGIDDNFYFAAHDSNPLLISILNKALTQLGEQEKRAIQAKWFGQVHVEQQVSKQVSITLSAEEKRWIAEHPVIRLAPDPDFPPLEYFNENGIYTGFVADIIKLIGKRTGLTFRAIQTQSYQESLNLVMSQQADVLPMTTEAKNLDDLLSFTDLFIKIPDVIVVQDKVKGLIALDDLKGKKVSTVAGWPAEHLIRERHPDIQLVVSKDINQAIEKLLFGEVDAMVALLSAVSYSLDTKGITHLRIAGNAFDIKPSVGVRKDWPELSSIISKGMMSITPQEQLEMTRRWISDNKVNNCRQ